MARVCTDAGNGFVNSDDQLNFLDNHTFRGLGWEQVQTAFTTPRLGVYQPISSLLLSVQYAIFGLNPQGYHATSLLLHCINALLLCFVVIMVVERRLGLASNASAIACGIATALFATHPLRTEPVAWATAQLYLVGGGFSLGSMIAYLKAHPADGETQADWLWGSYGLAAASMLSMPGAVSLPLMFLIVDHSIPWTTKHPRKATVFCDGGSSYGSRHLGQAL